MANFTKPLDFESIISYGIGDATYFVYFALMGFSILAAKWRMPSTVYLLLMYTFLIMLYLMGFNDLGLLVTIIIAPIIFGGLAKLMKQ